MNTEISYLSGSVLDIPLQNRLGLDSLVIFRKRGFHPTNILTTEYLSEPNPSISPKRTLVFSYNLAPRKGMVYGIVSKELDELVALGGRKVGIGQLEYSDHNGMVVDDSRADDLLRQCVCRWVEEREGSCSLESISILTDGRCRSTACSRLVNCQGNVFSHEFLSRENIGGIFAPILRGFTKSQGSWMGYRDNPKEGVLLETLFYDRRPEQLLTAEEYREMVNRVFGDFAAHDVKNIATFGMYLKDTEGKELTRLEDDTQILGILEDWVRANSDKGITVYYVNSHFPKK